MQNRERVLCLRAAAKRLRMPERTLRYRASRGRIAGAFKQGKLWKFSASALLFLSGVACTTTSAHFAAPSLRKPAAEGFAVLAVSMDEEGWDVVRPYIVRHELNYRVLMASADIDKIYPGMDAWPYTYLIDRQGKIAWSHMGVASKPTMRQTIEHLLGE